MFNAATNLLQDLYHEHIEKIGISTLTEQFERPPQLLVHGIIVFNNIASTCTRKN